MIVMVPNGKDYDHTPPESAGTQHSNIHAHSVVIPPPLTTANILHNDKQIQTTTMPESAIRFKSLECLVAVLRSLVGCLKQQQQHFALG
ncbi:hypothetical protein G6F68_016346 [Rhizopus microsporus]|nr:hypothetical protein G6F68_016346 [Rhizopus microsporus]